jgi:hypothetical protein
MNADTCRCPKCSSDRQAADAMTRYKAKQAAQREMVGSAGRLQQIIDAAYTNPEFLQSVNMNALNTR